VILLEVDAAGIAVHELERDAPRPIDVDRIAGRLEAPQRMKTKAGNIISSGRAATSKRSRRRKTRACIFASIFAVSPRSQSSARPLLLKLLITAAT